MNDIDTMLRADGTQWRALQPSPPDLDAAVRAATNDRQPRWYRHRAVAAVVAGLTVAAIAVIGAIVATNHRGPSLPPSPAASPTAPPTIRVDGKAIPFAGPVPWSDAVSPGPASRVIYVFADGDALSADVCGPPAERVYLIQSDHSVQVLVAGYGVPGLPCAGVALPAQRIRFVLTRPLGSRSLVDASDGTGHPVLDAATVPTLGHLPAGYLAAPITWDDRTGAATRLYWHGAPGTRPLIMLETGLTLDIDGRRAPDGRVIEHVTIGGESATVWHETDRAENTTTIQWARSGSREFLLAFSGSPDDHLSLSEAITLARSVHD